ncbi:MAG: polysaccharide biosynthesis tyrosine autokinase [Pirellulales bacterium]
MTEDHNGEGELVDRASAHTTQGIMYFLRVIKYRKNIIIATMVIACLLGALHFATAPRIYQSSASLLIIQKGHNVLSSTDTADTSHTRALPTYSSLITSPVVLQEAAKKLDPRHRPYFSEDSVSTALVSNTNIVNVTYRTTDPEAAPAVLNAVISAFSEFIDETHKGGTREIIEVLTKEKDELKIELQNQEAELAAARQRFGDLSVRASGDVVHPVIERAIQLNQALVEAQKERLVHQAHLAALQTAVKRGEGVEQYFASTESEVGREALFAALGISSNTASLQSTLTKTLLDQRSTLNELTQYYGDSHPRIIEIARRIRMTEQFLQQVNSDIDSLDPARIGSVLIDIKRQALAKASEKESAIQATLEQTQAAASSLQGDIAQVELLTREVERLHSFYTAMVNQISNADLRQEHGEIRATITKQPKMPKDPVLPQLNKIAFGSLAAGLLTSLLIVYLLDLFDDRFRSPEDFQRQLGVPLLAVIRQLDEQTGEGTESIEAFAAPNSSGSEAFRTLRTTLAFSPHETERLVVSSSEPGDGKTTVIANLAVSFAQVGKKVLLIDADMRRPGLSKLLTLKGENGLAETLTAEREVAQLADQFLYETDVDGLDVIPCGLRRANPAELLASSRFSDLLAWAEANYDQILIDSPPVLVATDAQIIGRQVDGAVLVVDVEKNHRRLVVRGVESFSSLGINLLGIVANRVRSDTSADYGYGYSYGYGYGSDFEDDPRYEEHDSFADQYSRPIFDEAPSTDASDCDYDNRDYEYRRVA